MTTASKSIGNDELAEKFTKAIEKISRGVAFAASLYL
jgi:superfamily II RNA helicase